MYGDVMTFTNQHRHQPLFYGLAGLWILLCHWGIRTLKRWFGTFGSTSQSCRNSNGRVFLWSLGALSKAAVCESISWIQMICSHIVQYSLSENLVLYYPKTKQIYLNINFWEVYPSFRNSHIHWEQTTRAGLTGPALLGIRYFSHHFSEFMVDPRTKKLGKIIFRLGIVLPCPSYSCSYQYIPYWSFAQCLVFQESPEPLIPAINSECHPSYVDYHSSASPPAVLLESPLANPTDLSIRLISPGTNPIHVKYSETSDQMFLNLYSIYYYIYIYI